MHSEQIFSSSDSRCPTCGVLGKLYAVNVVFRTLDEYCPKSDVDKLGGPKLPRRVIQVDLKCTRCVDLYHIEYMIGEY